MNITAANFSHQEILKIKPFRAFEWVKTGHWSRADFEKWLEVTISNQVKLSYILGLRMNSTESVVLSKDVN